MRMRAYQWHEAVSMEIGRQLIKYVEYIAEPRITSQVGAPEIAARGRGHSRRDNGVFARCRLVKDLAAEIGVLTMRLRVGGAQRDIAVDISGVETERSPGRMTASRP